MKARKMLKKLLAAALSATMVVGMTMTSFAGSGTGTSNKTDIDVGFVGYDNVVNVVLPAEYKMAFNPDELSVKTVSGTTAVTDQIVSRNFGFVNKTAKDVNVTAILTVATTGNMTLVNAVTAVPTAVTDKSAKVYLAMAAANGPVTEAISGSSTVGISAYLKETSDAKKTELRGLLSNVQMTKDDTNKVAVVTGENRISFRLEKATVAVSGGTDLTLDNLEDATFAVSDMGSKGASGFTFTGTMNKNAQWTSKDKVTISVDYRIVLSDGNETYKKSDKSSSFIENPTVVAVFTTGDGVGTIKYDASKVGSITKIEMTNSTGTYDGYHAFSTKWSAATNANGVITFDSRYVAFYNSSSSTEATVTYTTKDGATATQKVNVKTSN